MRVPKTVGKLLIGIYYVTYFSLMCFIAGRARMGFIACTFLSTSTLMETL
jgi:hypothetical protein